MPKAMIVTVGTGRDRKDIASAIRYSVMQHNPDFIRFLVSGKSEKETLPHIIDGLSTSYDIKRCEEINDVEKIYFEYVQFIRELENKGFSPGQIVADYTSGTKSMSAGCLLASFAVGVGTISYVYGERDAGGRVVAGTERPMSFQPNRIFAEKFLSQARHLFNIHRFESCGVLCEEVEKIIAVTEVIDESRFLRRLSLAYDCWDRFEFKKALEYLSELKDNPMLQRYGIKSRTETNKTFLFREKEALYCYERVVDLIANAKRRFEDEGRFDDGLARLYRGFEYLSQVRLYKDHNSIETGSLDVQKLPESLRGKYRKKNNEAGKIQISLFAGYDLLKDLDDRLGIKFMEDFKNNKSLKLALKKRNDSILAHGFTPIEKKDAESLLHALEEYVQMCCDNYSDKLKNATFPELKS